MFQSFLLFRRKNKEISKGFNLDFEFSKNGKYLNKKFWQFLKRQKFSWENSFLKTFCFLFSVKVFEPFCSNAPVGKFLIM
jgi:hypothetical protein